MAGWFEAIRAECSRSVWSRGVELVRGDAPVAERVDDEEAVFRVGDAGGLLTPRVTLLLDDGSWDCDCPGLDDPCEHVAAAAILLNRARKQGVSLATVADGAAGAHVRYCFLREGNGLAFERRIVDGEHQTRVETSLKEMASRSDGPRLLTSDSDLSAERALAASGLLSGRGRPSARAHARILPALTGCEDVRLDGRPIRVSEEPLLPQGRLEDDGDGFRLWVEPDPAITETFVGRVALCGDVLRPVRESGLTGRELQELPHGRCFPAERALELATEILPDLQRRIPVEIRTRRLPETGRAEPPRIRVETRREGDALAVRGDLVYGDPPRARVEEGRLVAVAGRVPPRDEPAEARLARVLASQLGLPAGREIQVRDREAIALAGRLEAFSGEVRGAAWRDFVLAPALRPRLATDAADFTLRFEVDEPAASGAPRGAGAEAVLRAFERGDSLVPLAGGGFAPLPGDWLARFGRMVGNLLDARAADGSLPSHALPDLARLAEALGEPPPPAFEPLRALVEDFRGIPHAEPPDDLAATLRAYQEAGVDWLCFLRDAGLGALLADDMGLGKTLQALCALRGRCLVVCPTSVLHGWAEEARRFRPGLRVGLYHGPGRALDPDWELTLTTYALLRLDVDTLGAVEWDVAVLDEAQAIKNPESQVARAAHALRAAWRLTLTGTPVENRLDELWSQVHFTNPGLLGSRASFQERYARPIAGGGPDAGSAGEELRTRTRPFVLRRLKRDVAPELPPRSDVVLRCELDAEERRVYDGVRAATRSEVVEKLRGGGSVLAALEALLRLRQAACHRGLVPGQHAPDSSKLALLRERLETALADGHKALVFSQWTSLLDRVEPHLRAAGVRFARLDGATADRAGVVAGFQRDDGPPVLLISLRAGGTGLNLTAADHVFLLDPWWNPAVEDQAADRAHRIGQTRPVLVHRLVAADTVEERILALQARKRAVAEAALGAPGEAAAGITRDDLLALLD